MITPRDDIITRDSERQLADGGFALSGDTADPGYDRHELQALVRIITAKKLFLPAGGGGSIPPSVRRWTKR